MIPPGRHEPNRNSAATGWRNELRMAIRSSTQLCQALGIESSSVRGHCDDDSEFPVLVPRSLLGRMRHGDADDPILRQVLAVRTEREASPGFSNDPLHESEFAANGIIRKYAGRALLVTTAACPVHCRYCFRRHFPYEAQSAARGRWSHALSTLQQSPQVHEVILSGGDPLSLSTDRLRELFEGLDAIPSVDTVRIHTRFPVIVPSRITTALLSMLEKSRLNTVVVLHCNHANELAEDAVEAALEALSHSVNQLLNQTVLLRGVNDSVDELCALSRSLLRARVSPYYLHCLDPVAGSAHFDVAEETALQLVGEMRRTMPGYLVPRLVREDPGALSKTPLS